MTEPSPTATLRARSPSCSVIIPLFNRVEYTARCLETLVAYTPYDSYEVILVDNASTDGTGALLDRLRGDVVIMRNGQNAGFAAACNQGAGVAKTDTLLFVNNDIEFLPGWLEPLLETIGASAQVAAVGAKLLYPDGRLQHGGVVIVADQRSNLLHGHHRFRGEDPDRPEVSSCQPVSGVTAALMVVKRADFYEVGGFDTGYWNGNEDVDFCLSLWASGRAVLYQPRSVAVHHESVSGPERWSRVTENVARLTERWLTRVRPEVVVDMQGVAHQVSPLARVDAPPDLRDRASPVPRGPLPPVPSLAEDRDPRPLSSTSSRSIESP